jgi:single-stranded-DNA-specific exonuclease
MGNASIAVELFTTKDANRADEIARQLEALNTQRQEIENKIMNDAIKQIERKELFNQSAIVVGGRGWHQGVIGIIASKITEIYGLPSIVVSLDGDTSKGSARSINGVNIFHAISECSDLLVSFGGHEMAAGIVVSEKRLREFNEKFLAIVKKTSEGLKKTGLQIDAELDIEEDLDGKLAEELQQLNPHGVGNPEPIFKSSEVIAIEPKIVKETHLKFRVKTKREGQVEAIGFYMAGMVEMLQKPVDIAYFPRLSEEGKLGLIIKGIKPSLK